MAETDGPAAAAPNDTVWPGNLLDAANRAIIEALQRDGRQPYGAIAEEVGLSEAAVRRRVQRLREAGIICEDDERLLHVLNDSVRSIPGVRATETFLYLKLAKQTYSWGTR